VPSPGSQREILFMRGRDGGRRGRGQGYRGLERGHQREPFLLGVL